MHEEKGWPTLATLGGSRGPTGLQEGEEARESTHDLDMRTCSRGATKYNVKHSPSYSGSNQILGSDCLYVIVYVHNPKD